MLETLSLGGGVISLKPDYTDPTFTDMGYCFDLTVNIEVVQSFKEKYVRGVGSNLIRVMSGDGVIESARITGKFICESFTRERLQSTWFRGESTDAGTEFLQLSTLTPILSALHFLSAPLSGPTICLIFPKVELSIVGDVEQIQFDWKNLPFEFNTVIEEGFMPTLRVQEEGESLVDFCT